MEIPKPLHWKVIYIEKKEIAKGVWSLCFIKPSPFLFLPGQYIDITLTITRHRQETYSFTISSTPSEEFLVITTRESSTDFKQSLLGLTKGQEVTIRGPLGLFTVNDGNILPKVFLAGGIGITPFRSILLSGGNHILNDSITLLASFPTKDDMVFKDEIDLVAKERPNIRIRYTLTKNKDPLWGGYTGRISRELIQEVAPSFANAEYFLAGRGEMVDEMVSLLSRMGVENKKIKTDIFTGL